MTRIFLSGVRCFVTCLFALGCAQSGDATRDPRGDGRKLVVQLGDKTLASPQPAVLNVSFDAATSDGMAELSWEVGDGTSLVVRAPYRELQAGRIEAALVAGPLEGEHATANLRIDGTAVASGKLSVTLSKGRIEGGVDAESLRFDGVLAVSCSVPESLLAAARAAPEPAADPGTERAEAAQAAAPVPDNVRAPQVLVDDLRFRSAQCARVKSDFH